MYILPIYSPITPSDSRISPPIARIDAIIVVHPVIVAPSKMSYKAVDKNHKAHKKYKYAEGSLSS